jgi:hypothetical protein
MKSDWIRRDDEKNLKDKGRLTRDLEVLRNRTLEIVNKTCRRRKEKEVE